MDILSELRKVYNQEWWHTVKLDREELDKYHAKMINKGNLLYVWDNGLVAYIEYWRINKEQLDQILVDDKWSAFNENTTTGDICYVANIWISPKYRGDRMLDRNLKNLFLCRNKNAKMIIWERHKKNKTMKLFTHIRRY